ncbi:MAG TPA: DOMON-like domain-containing protein [Anaerolineales bacterium]|nr:DOMON-like domain-containing protein [Anaerolineales bacterium]
MIAQGFTLIPFPAVDIPAISLTGRLLLEKHVLTLHYTLSGNTDCVLLPHLSQTPGRKDELWRETCFEFFLAVKDQPGYWEFNMSPSGNWNVYRMDAYRRIGFREETAISKLEFEFGKGMDGHSLDVSVDLTPLFTTGSELQLAIAAVIQTRDGDETYWALIHPAPNADFHLRESFILELAEQIHPSPQSALDG